MNVGDHVRVELGTQVVNAVIVKVNEDTIIVTTDGKNRIKRHKFKHIR